MKRGILLLSSFLLIFFLSACGGRSVKIEFDALGGSQVESITIRQLEGFTEPVTERVGYTFRGWYTEAEFANEFDFAQGATRNIKLYAKWEINQYTVTFVTNNGTDIESITLDYQATLNLPMNLTKEGANFGGWYLNANFSSAFNATRMVAEDITLYAKWNPVVYFIEFYVDDVLLTTRQVNHGETLTSFPTVPNQEGYNGSWDFDIDTVITENKRVDAVYEIKTYTVVFVDQWDHVYHSFTVNHGDTVGVPSVNPEKVGYDFAGYSEDLETLVIYEDTEIEVFFTPKMYLVTFRVQGSQVKTEQVIHGGNATPPTVDVAGYTFVGWDKAYTNITANTEINANLTAIIYDVVLNANGGDFDGDLTLVISRAYQSTFTSNDQPYRLGYLFRGWYLNPEGTGNQVVLNNYTMPLNGLILYAKWEIVQYTITYSYLYGTQNGNPLTYNVNSSFDLINPTSRTGYNFVGWFDEAEGGNQVTTFALGTTGEKLLYARWQAISYNITYSGLFETVHGNPSTYTIEDNVFLTSPATRLGYTFIGWFTQASGGSQVTSILSGSSGDRTLYARWQVVTYNIFYHNLQGATHSNPTGYNVDSNQINLTDPSSRPGYTFVGWFDELVGGNEVEVIANGSTGEKQLYARWQVNNYTITYDSAGGDAIAEQTVTYGEEFVLAIPEREGYTFVNWQRGGVVFNAGVWNLVENVNLVAVWTANTYQISFDSNGGLALGDLEVTYGQVYVLPDASRAGYVFSHWTLAGEEFESGVWTLLGDIELVAHYLPRQYNITYNNLFDTVHSNPLTYNIEDTEIVLSNPSLRAGYTFVGWFTHLTSGEEVESILTGSTGDLVLYARWIANTYTITFAVGDGEEILPLSVTFNQSFVLPVAVQVGFSFAGWQFEGVDFVDGIWTLTNDITLDAVWTEWAVISFVSNGGSSVSSISEYPLTEIDAPTAPTRAGYTFAGWFTDNGTFLNEYVFDLMPEEDVVLFAKWTANTYYISFEVDGGIEIDVMAVVFGESFVLPEAVKVGYTYLYWSYLGDEFNPSVYNVASNILLTAVYEENIYTISFDVDGGTEIIALEISFGDHYNLADAVKTHYDFVRWELDGVAFDKEGYWYIDDNITLVAIYTPHVYQITYYGLEGATNPNPTSYTIESDTIVLVDPSPRNGYVFGHWYIDPLGDEEIIYTIPTGSTGDIEIYAHWDAILYAVNYFNLQGGTHSNPSHFYVYSDDIIFTDAVRTGYTFEGWFDALEGGNKVDGIPSGTYDDVFVYARWTANTYTITFDVDGGEVIAPLEVTYDQAFVLVDAVKENYDFVEWQLDGVKFESGTYLLTDNITLVAIYQGVPLTVSYNTGEGSSIADDTVLYGSSTTPPTPPTRNGYTFKAWYSDPQLATLYDFNNIVTENITLYAAWELDFYTWNVEYVFLIEDLDDPGLVEVEAGNPPFYLQYTNLIYGQELNLYLAFEGYVFSHFVYDGDSYYDIEQLFMVMGNMPVGTVSVFYRKVILTITFAQDPSLFDPASDAVVSYRVYYNSTFLLEDGPVLVQPASGLAVWDRTEFVNLRTDLTVYALYYQTGVKTVTFIDRGVIRYIASAVDELDLEVIGEGSLLWNLYRPGYYFLGWYTEAVGGDLIPQGDLLFADFVDLRTSLYARWLELERFNNPTNIVVEADEEEIVISWTLNPSTINTYQPAGFEYILNNVLISGLTKTPVLVGNTYTLTLLSTDADFALFSDLANPGTHQLSIRALGDEVNHYHSEFADVATIVIESVYSGDPTEVAVYDYFIIETFEETKRYIFYTNLEYQFGSSYSFEIVTGQEFASADQNKIFTNGLSGSFKFRMIRDGYPTVVYDALVVHDIKQFAYGTNYQNFLDAKTIGQTQYLNQAVNYYVGSGNDFYLDLRMVNNQGSRIPLAQTILDYKLYQYVAGDYQLISSENISNHLSFLPDNRVKFTGFANGKTYKLVVEPKYQATAMQVDELEFIFVINSGVNVFNNLQLKEYYSDFDVNIINIHASFKAELSSSQRNTDGSPINKRPTISSPVTGNVYQRFSESIDDDSLIIEGNFMTIDGSELPFSNANSGSGTVGFAQSFEIINVQVGIFYYGVNNNALGTTNNNYFSVNNLTVKGNTQTPYVDFSGTAEEIEIQERLMSRNSGGYIGFYMQKGEIDFTNTVIFNTVIAISNIAYGYKTDLTPNYMTLDYLKVYNSWANSLYLYSGSGMLIYNSEIGQSGGAAIHVVDSRPAVFDEFGVKISDPNPLLLLDDSTTINNWVSGEEAWFKAYGMSQVALTLKVSIENGIAGTERSIINLMTDPVTGLQTEKINFILLTEPSIGAVVNDNSEVPQQISGSEIDLSLDGINLHRSFDFLKNPTDGRVMGSGDNKQFAAPVGDYSEFSDFYQLIMDIYALIAPAYPGGTPSSVIEEDATNLANIGSFYGLTAVETVNTYGYASGNSISFRTALETIYPGKTYPRFIEILSPVPVFPNGYAVVIVQFSE